jgi:hypothetical protein
MGAVYLAEDLKHHRKIAIKVLHPRWPLRSGQSGFSARSRSPPTCRSGGPARLLVRFDDPTREWHRFGFSAHGERFYFTLGDRESDIWTGEVAKAPRQ